MFWLNAIKIGFSISVRSVALAVCWLQGNQVFSVLKTMQEGNIVMTKTKEHMRAMYINNTGKVNA